MSKLTFAEFEELLRLVVSIPLECIDRGLGVLSNMSVPWYQGLMRVLMQRYRDEHRVFCSTDGNVLHLVCTWLIN
jgi:hypothetical protein